jgi:pimeloyl-ACP methyl ester carboxylesterase
MPEGDWQGDLLVYAHGYVSPFEPVGIPEDQLVLPDGTSITNTVTSLGFAFAATSYITNGLAVKNAVTDVVDLVDIFATRKGMPAHTYLVGASEGGLITALATERHSDVFDGGLPTCGPVGSLRRQINYWGDARVLFDYFFPDVLPDFAPDQDPLISQDLIDNWATYEAQIREALVAQPDQTEQLLRVARVPEKRGDFEANVDALVQLMWYNVFATNDAVAKLGGQPYDNASRWYCGSDDDHRLNEEVVRFEADPEALDEVEMYYETSGDLTAPMVTLHTLKDSVAPYWHEPIYRWKIRAEGAQALHANIPSFRYGHCNFSVVEALLALGLLVHKVTDHGLENVENVLTPDQLAEYARMAQTHGLGLDLSAPVAPPSIERDVEPVVVTGADLPHLAGTPSDALFVYAYQDGSLQQIPFQVDERASGTYTTTVGSPLDGDDEVVFMASDLGAPVSHEEINATLPVSPTSYQIQVSDPLAPSAEGWAYIVRSSSLTKTFTQTYAAFDASTKQITTTQYAMGFAENYPYFDHLALNDSGVDVVDRSKIRIQTLLGTLTEESPLLQLPSVGLIKDGPVRVIVREGSAIGYQGMLQTSLTYTLPTWLDISAIRLSTDFNEDAVSSTFYNANTPAGVTVDGNPDSVAAEPASPWWQLSGETGTIVQVSDASLTGGTLLNYYYDDDTTPEPKPTGDGKSYGDSGLRVESPDPTVSYRALLYVLPPDQENVGETYADYFAHPLQVTARALFHHHIYLPLVMRN